MKTILLATLALFIALMPGCSSVGSNIDVDRIQQQTQLMQQLMKEPDLTTWYTQRDRITDAMGDRVFDKEYNRVFNAMVPALAKLGMSVENMEKESGFISARGLVLPPDQMNLLRKEELVLWCQAKGYSPSLLENHGQFNVDVDVAGRIMQKTGTTLTITLVKQSEKQTKVKLRFNGMNYPRTLEESYKAAWPAIDKQIFIDTGTD